VTRHSRAHGVKIVVDPKRSCVHRRHRARFSFGTALNEGLFDSQQPQRARSLRLRRIVPRLTRGSRRCSRPGRRAAVCIDRVLFDRLADGGQWVAAVSVFRFRIHFLAVRPGTRVFGLDNDHLIRGPTGPYRRTFHPDRLCGRGVAAEQAARPLQWATLAQRGLPGSELAGAAAPAYLCELHDVEVSERVPAARWRRIFLALQNGKWRQALEQIRGPARFAIGWQELRDEVPGALAAGRLRQLESRIDGGA